MQIELGRQTWSAYFCVPYPLKNQGRVNNKIGGNMRLHTTIGRVVVAGALAIFASTTFSKTTIRATSWHPPKHPGVVGGYAPFIDYVKEASDGEIDFRFWSGR